jgi:hypothetical protein
MPRTITGQIDGLDINVPEADTKMLDRFISNNNANLKLIGAASFSKFYESMLKSYEIVWPKLAVSYDPNNFVKQHLIQFKNYDGTEIYSYYVDHGQTVTDPSSKIADKLIKPADEQYTYTFEDWSPKIDTSIAVTSSKIYTAMYSKETRKYLVT